MSQNDPHEAPTDAAPPPPPPPPPPPAAGRPPLVRRADDRAIAGVAAAVARHLGIDPVIVRIVLAALAFAGGVGVLAYLAGWLLIPSEAGGEVRAPGSLATVAGIVVLVIAAFWVVPGTTSPFDEPFVGLACLALVGALLWYAARDLGDDRTVVARRVGQALVLVAVSGALAIGAFWIAAAGGDLAMAIVVLVAGAALLVGAVTGGLRWLVLPAFAVALGTAVVAASGIDLRGGVGERTFRPASLEEVEDRYELGAGELELDLRDVDFEGRTKRVAVHLGLGEARVVVPPGTCVGGSARIGVGEARLLARSHGGVDVDVAVDAPRGGTGTLIIDADMGIGGIVVDTEGRGFDDGWDDDGPVLTAAGCAA